jgi:hypothetical protein
VQVVGPWPSADSANRYKIARGEAMECAASLDVMKLRRLVTQDRYDRGAHSHAVLSIVKAFLCKRAAERIDRRWRQHADDPGLFADEFLAAVDRLESSPTPGSPFPTGMRPFSVPPEVEPAH